MISKRFFSSLILITVLSALATENATAQTLYGSAGAQDQRENAANADWAYNWGNEPNHNISKSNFEFVPMIWSGSPGGVGTQINRILNLEENFGQHVDYVLGFNEPELPTQANMTVETALATWDVMTNAFENTDIKLVSPAVSGNGGIQNWLVPFMAEVETRNNDSNPDNDLQVDAIAYHFYTVAFNPQVEAQKLINQIDDLWVAYQRPIWITEFAGTSFSLDNPVHSVEERTAFNRAFLQALIPMFEARDYIERVAWWQFGALGQPYSALSTSSNGVFTPTGIGEVYFRTILESGQAYDLAAGETAPTYVHYLKGGTLTNTGAAMDVALRAVDNLEGSSVISGTSDFGFEDAEDAFIRVRSGTTLSKSGSNTITLSGSPFFNEGTVLVEAGTLQLEDGAQLTGAGTLRIDGGGVLATSAGVGGEEVLLDSQTIILNQGVLHVADARAEITRQLRLLNPSEVRTDGDLLISGSTDGAGRILSTGAGTLFLSGAGGHASGATVSQGQLVVANAEFSATGAGNILVNGSGTFGGFGLVDGGLQVTGGTVAPGVFQSSYGTQSVPPFEAGVIVDAINFDFTGIQDDAPLTQTGTLDGGLQLVSGLDFGPGVQPRGAANNGDEFNVAGFPSNDNYGAASNNGDYLTFTVAAIDGLAMVIDDVTFQLRRNGGNAATKYAIGSSIGGFTYAERWGEITLASNNTTTQNFTASNPGSEAIADDVEIRLIGLLANSSSGNTHFYNVSLDASFESDPNSVAFDPTGVLDLGGDYTQLDFGTLQIELGGTSNADPANAEFDQLIVAGDVQLDGTLELSFVEDYQPNAGDTFDIITGNSISGIFSSVNMPTDIDLSITYADTFVRVEVLDDTFLLGDVNCDGMVSLLDVAPFVELITSGQYLDKADINSDGVVDLLDVGPFVNLLL